MNWLAAVGGPYQFASNSVECAPVETWAEQLSTGLIGVAAVLVFGLIMWKALS